MGLLREIADHLAAAPQSLGVVGESLFLGYLPSDPGALDEIGAVYETGGLAPEYGLGDAGIRHETPGIQVVFRGTPRDYEGPRAKAETAYRALAAIQAQALGSTFFHWIHPQQAPFVITRDAKERVVVGFNALCEKELSA